MTRRRRSPVLTALTGIVLIYSLIPLAWLVVNATKTQDGLFTSFGLWFDDGRFALWENVRLTLTYDDGIFLRWLGNTLLYVVAGAGGATITKKVRISPAPSTRAASSISTGIAWAANVHIR